MAAKKKKPKKVDPRDLCGWHEDPREVNRMLGEFQHPIFGVSAASSNIVGSGKGVVSLLYKPVEKVLGHFPIHLQTIGDCVSHACGTAVDVHKCVRIVLKNLREEFRAETATEGIYAASRVEIAGGQLGNQDGSTGAWGVAAMKNVGTLARLKYPGSGGHRGIDLRTYSGNRAKTWGGPRGGVPDWLEPTAREHPVLTASLVRSFEEAADAIANGYPVVVCSNVGFKSVRNKYGFLAPEGQWPHAMVFIASDYKSRRPGLLCMNSWGPDWVSGGKRYGQPDGSFWVTPQVCNRMFSEGDSWSVSGFAGYPSQQGAGSEVMLLI
jgi:hypothetical protein